MAAPRFSSSLLRNLTRSNPRSSVQQLRIQSLPSRAYSSDPPPPPLLAKLKGDLKSAMRAKDAPRLAVLRSVLATTLNASKTNSPIQTDLQLVNLLRKQARSQRESVQEFRAANREDLAEKEEAQIRILEEYANGSGVQSITGDELRSMIEAVVGELAAEGTAGSKVMGESMKKLFSPGGVLEGKDVDKAEVTSLLKELAQ